MKLQEATLIAEATRQTLARPGEANSQAATRVNPGVASLNRPPQKRGDESAEPLFLRRRLTHSPDVSMRHREGEKDYGSPAYQGWHVRKVLGSNTGGP